MASLEENALADAIRQRLRAVERIEFTDLSQVPPGSWGFFRPSGLYGCRTVAGDPMWAGPDGTAHQITENDQAFEACGGPANDAARLAEVVDALATFESHVELDYAVGGAVKRLDDGTWDRDIPVSHMNPYWMPGESAAEHARRRGWQVGTRLVSDDGAGPQVVTITGIGESLVLGRRETPPQTERPYPLHARNWVRVIN